MKRARPYKSKRPAKRRRPSSAYNPSPANYTVRPRSSYLEYKVTDASWVQDMGTVTPPVSITANLVRGTGAINNFIGLKVFPVSLELKYDIYTTTMITCMPVRVILFQWFDNTTPTNNGAAPTDVLQYVGIGSTTHSPKNLTNRENMRILYDKKIALNSFSNNVSVVSFKKFIKGFKMSEISFVTGSNVVQKGDLYLLTVADINSASYYPQFKGTARLTFTD